MVVTRKPTSTGKDMNNLRDTANKDNDTTNAANKADSDDDTLSIALDENDDISEVKIISNDEGDKRSSGSKTTNDNNKSNSNKTNKKPTTPKLHRARRTSDLLNSPEKSKPTTATSGELAARMMNNLNNDTEETNVETKKEAADRRYKAMCDKSVADAKIRNEAHRRALQGDRPDSIASALTTDIHAIKMRFIQSRPKGAEEDTTIVKIYHIRPAQHLQECIKKMRDDCKVITLMAYATYINRMFENEARAAQTIREQGVMVSSTTTINIKLEGNEGLIDSTEAYCDPRCVKINRGYANDNDISTTNILTANVYYKGHFNEPADHSKESLQVMIDALKQRQEKIRDFPHLNIKAHLNNQQTPPPPQAAAKRERSRSRTPDRRDTNNSKRGKTYVYEHNGRSILMENRDGRITRK